MKMIDKLTQLKGKNLSFNGEHGDYVIGIIPDDRLYNGYERILEIGEECIDTEIFRKKGKVGRATYLISAIKGIRQYD